MITETMEYKKIIADKGFKIKHIAKELGIGATLLSMKLSGKRNFVKDEMTRLDKLLGISLDEMDAEFAVLELFYNGMDKEVESISAQTGIPKEKVAKIIRTELKKEKK